MRFLAVLLAPLAVVAGCSDSTSPERGAPPHPTESTTTVESQTSSTTRTTQAISIVEVVDGDTIVVQLADGRERVRLIGVNAPERGECLADDAAQLLQDLVADGTVELVADRSDRDGYGRLLRYVEVDDVDVGAELVRAGVALARRYPPDTARSDGYDALQREAEDVGAGMWTVGACGTPATGSDVVISEIRFDADGDDDQNRNDEWVRITNRGSADVDLSGWVLKDTSASHRYPFPDGFLLGPGASVTVRTGCGTDTAADLHWCNERSAVWNNSGDTAFLLDPPGNIVSSQDG